MKRLRANTLKDHCNFFLHFGLTAGVATGAALALGCPPILGAIALTATAGIHFGVNSKVKRALQEAIDEEKRSNASDKVTIDFEGMMRDLNSSRRPVFQDYVHRAPRFNPRIQSWVDGFAEKLGMKKTPNLLVMDRESRGGHDPKGGILKKAMREFLREHFNQTANAFAFKHSFGNVVLTSPIVEELNPRELKNVVAHEMGHLAAHHTARQQAIALISTPAKILTSLNYLVTAYSSWRSAGLNIAAGAAGALVAGFVAKTLGWSEEEKRDKPKIQSLKQVFATAAVVGAGVAFGAPDLAAAAALNFGVNKTLHLLEKRYSRRNEFQADRIAADLTGDPVGMSEGLRKIAEVHRKSSPYGDVVQEEKERQFLSSLFGRIGDLTKTHPNMDRRCDRLSHMEQRAEYVYA